MAISLTSLAPTGQPWGAAGRWGASPGGGAPPGLRPWGQSHAFGAPGYTTSAWLQAEEAAQRANRDANANWAAQQNAWNAGNAGWGGPGTQTGNSSPFTAETLTRNPELAAILNRIYPQIDALSTDPNRNQTVIQRNVRAPEVEAAAQGALTQQQADAHNNAQSIRDFTTSWMAAQPAATATANQEAGAIGRLYDGSYAGDLAENRRETGILTTQNLMRRLGQISASGNLGELSRGGVTNSFDQANLLGEAARASLARDLEFQGQERADISDVMNRQTGAAGLRQRLIDAVLQRPLVPIQAGQATSAADLNRLSGVSNLILGNNVFTPQSQAQLIQQVQQLLSGQASLDPAANYRYVQGNFPDSYPGMAPQSNLRLPNIDLGGGGTSFDQLLASLNGSGGAQPSFPQASVNRVLNPSGFGSYNDVVAGDPTGRSQNNQRNARLAELMQSFAAMGYDPNAIMNWLSNLSPEALARVPMGGFE